MIVSDDLVRFIDEMIVDENQSHALTGFKKTKSGIKTSVSDHMTIITKFNLPWRKNLRKARTELFNLKDF